MKRVFLSVQRFARLQRTAAKLARGRGQPKGVFRFSSHKACNEWTDACGKQGHAAQAV